MSLLLKTRNLRRLDSRILYGFFANDAFIIIHGDVLSIYLPDRVFTSLFYKDNKKLRFEAFKFTNRNSIRWESAYDRKYRSFFKYYIELINDAVIEQFNIYGMSQTAHDYWWGVLDDVVDESYISDGIEKECGLQNLNKFKPGVK